MTKLNKNKLNYFLGLRTKLLLPLLLGAILLPSIAIPLIRSAINTAGKNIFDMKLIANLSQITHNGITIDIHYKKGYDGVYEGNTLNIKNEDVFSFDWANTKKTSEIQKLGGNFFAGGYIYSPERHVYILAEPFRSNKKLPLTLDGSVKGGHSGASLLDLLQKIGSARFHMKIDNNYIECLAVCNKNKSRLLLVCTNGQNIDGLALYLSRQVGLIMASILLCAICSTAFIIFRTVRRLTKIDNYLDTVTKDSLPSDQLVIKSKDEVEDMSNVINRMVADLRDKQRIETELNSAANIQLGMLPKNFTVFSNFSNHNRFNLYATMKPAREVGGDFYDFFMPDNNHLAFIVADVSGKGVPAALFMVMGKTLLRGSIHINADKELQDTMSQVNSILCENNENDLFITVWAGLLNLTTGELTFCNAGHNPPLLMRNCKNFEYLNDIHGTVMGFLKKGKYKQTQITLSPGDKLYLYTDGVTEAQNKAQELYNDDRLRDCLNAHKQLAPKEMLAVVKGDVDTFVDGAEQFDDMTMLMVEYLG